MRKKRIAKSSLGKRPRWAPIVFNFFDGSSVAREAPIFAALGELFYKEFSKLECHDEPKFEAQNGNQKLAEAA